MGRKPARLKWFKFYFDKYLDGSTSRELTSSERGVFVGLLSLAARANNHGWIDADTESLPRLLDAPGPVVQRTLEKCQAPGPDGEPKIHIDGHRVQVVKFDEYNPERWERQLYDSRHENTNNVDNVGGSTNDSKTRPDQTRPKEKRSTVPKVPKLPFGEEGTVKLTQDEYDKLLQRFGESDTKDRIQRLENYVLSHGRKYASHYRTILMWAERDGSVQRVPPPMSGRQITEQDAAEEAERRRVAMQQMRTASTPEGVGKGLDAIKRKADRWRQNHAKNGDGV